MLKATVAYFHAALDNGGGFDSQRDAYESGYEAAEAAVESRITALENALHGYAPDHPLLSDCE
jgi:hypothetical protein